jgi:predicted site-specific integrase-resolvase
MFVKIDPNTLLTPQDTADLLGVSTATLARWRYEGTTDLRFVKLTRKTVKYRYADIEAFIRARSSFAET